MVEENVEDKVLALQKLAKKIYTEFPESDSRDKLFMVPIEDDLIDIINNLPETSDKNSVHIGLSGMMNLDIIAKRKSGYAFLFDIADMDKMYKIIGATITELKEEYEEVSERMNKFSEKFGKKLYEEKVLGEDFYSKCDEKEIKYYLTKKHSWCFLESRYEHIEQMFLENKMVFTKIDITDTDKFKIIGDILTDNDLKTDTIYLSNVYDWLLGRNIGYKVQDTNANRNDLLKSLKYIITKDTTLFFAHSVGIFTPLILQSGYSSKLESIFFSVDLAE